MLIFPPTESAGTVGGGIVEVKGGAIERDALRAKGDCGKYAYRELLVAFDLISAVLATSG